MRAERTRRAASDFDKRCDRNRTILEAGDGKLEEFGRIIRVKRSYRWRQGLECDVFVQS